MQLSHQTNPGTAMWPATDAHPTASLPITETVQFNLTLGSVCMVARLRYMPTLTSLRNVATSMAQPCRHDHSHRLRLSLLLCHHVVTSSQYLIILVTSDEPSHKCEEPSPPRKGLALRCDNIRPVNAPQYQTTCSKRLLFHTTRLPLSATPATETTATPNRLPSP